MKNNPFQNLISDAAENGNLAGDFLAMAKLDIIAAECLNSVLTHPSDHLTVEACVANYLATHFCDPLKENFRIKTALIPSVPVVNSSLRARAYSEIDKWFAALSGGYKPTPTSENKTIRSKIRCEQLAAYSKDFAAHYRATVIEKNFL